MSNPGDILVAESAQLQLSKNGVFGVWGEGVGRNFFLDKNFPKKIQKSAKCLPPPLRPETHRKRREQKEPKVLFPG